MPKYTSGIHDVPNRMRAVAAELIRRAADSHVSVSKQLAPVSPDGSHGNPPGFMRDSIHVEGAAFDPSVGQFRNLATGRFQKFTGSEDLQRKVIVGAEYGLFVEFGTENMDGQPFFIPGYESASRQLKTEARDVIGSELAKVERKAA